MNAQEFNAREEKMARIAEGVQCSNDERCPVCKRENNPIWSGRGLAVRVLFKCSCGKWYFSWR